MSKRIQGFITSFDKFGRMCCQFPAYHTNEEKAEKKDTLNTEKQLRAFEKTYEGGYNPVFKTSFIAKTDKKTFAYSSTGVRILKFDELIGKLAEFEVDFLPFVGNDRTGWFIRVASIKVVKDKN